MTAPLAAPAVVRQGDLRIGELLAEGGEGQVYELPRQPQLVFKRYRRPAVRDHLEDLVAWPDRLTSAQARSTIRSASAWPGAVVAGAGGSVLGLLMPRAPRRFSLRHRDGRSRLASLSYLTADPGHRAVAYGLHLPPAAGPERVGLAYALARLLAAFESGDPAIGHGDLSTKNVLWSLQRGPEVFVIDCDNCERYDADGEPLGGPSRRRAMTPNWDDPSVPRGRNPRLSTDRYSLALIFMRIVGAANFPIQARQRTGDAVEMRFPVPPGRGSEILLDPANPLWELCARSLSKDHAERRPPASAWLGPLEALLDGMGSAATMRAVWAAQGGGRPSPVTAPEGDAPTDVRILPAPVARRPRTFVRVSPSPRFGGVAPARGPAIGYRTGASQFAPSSPPARIRPADRIPPELKAQVRRLLRWWLGLHRSVLHALTRPGRLPARLRAIALCGLIDFVVLVLAAAGLALVVSPMIGI